MRVMYTYTDRQIAAFSELISLNHSEMPTFGVWHRVLELITEIVPCDSAAVMFFWPDTGVPESWVQINIEDGFLEHYKSHYQTLETIMPTALAKGLRVWRPEDVVGDRTWRSTETYQSLSRVQGLKNNVTMAVPRDTGLALWVRLFKTTMSSRFTDGEMEILGLIQTHIAAAVKRYEELGQGDAMMEALRPSIERSCKPCFMFDHDVELVHMSESARKICETAEDKQAALATLKKNAAALLDNMPGFRAPTDDQIERLIRIGPKTYGLVFLPLQLPGHRAHYLLFASDVGDNMLAICERAMSSMGLSAKESEVCRMLVKGCSNGEIAEKMQVTVLTIKDHAGSIMEKAGASSRSQVLTKLLSL